MPVVALAGESQLYLAEVMPLGEDTPKVIEVAEDCQPDDEEGVKVKVIGEPPEIV